MIAPLIFEGLENRIQQRTGWRVREFSIEICDDRAILRGKASSAVTRQLAGHLVGDSCPDYLIENGIEIDYPDEFLPGVPLS